MLNPRLLIIVTGYNCVEYVEKCFDSIRKQQYKHYEVVIVDDASTDLTAGAIQAYKDKKWSFYRLSTNRGTVYARHFAWKQHHKNYDVIVWLDLDDTLYTCRALNVVAEAYHQNPDTWLTYGNYIDNNWQKHYSETTIHYSQDIKDRNAYRHAPFKFTHLRTYRRELYEKLTVQDLFVPGLVAYPDYNMLICLLELAGAEHITTIPWVIYKYNITNPMAALKRFSQYQREKETEIVRKITPKEKLKSL